MSRQPAQAHIFLCREKDGVIEYAVFKRSDMTFCSHVPLGILMEGEAPDSGAARILRREYGVDGHMALHPLKSVEYAPVNLMCMEKKQGWGAELAVIPVHFFYVLCSADIACPPGFLSLSWNTYNTARDLLYYEYQKDALDELDRKLALG